MHRIEKELSKLRNTDKAKALARFFKTGKGEYGEGDKFLGVMMPEQREIARAHRTDSLESLAEAIENPWHEVRMTALCALVYKFEKADEEERKRIFVLYLRSTRWINNWDLVDVTCPKIVGEYTRKNRKILYELAKSKSLWEKRIAIISTLRWIAKEDTKDVLAIAKLLLNDEHDLIHKAVGWVLREVGKKDISTLRKFLDEHAAEMPRTMLRYSIEKMSPAERKKFLLYSYATSILI